MRENVIGFEIWRKFFISPEVAFGPLLFDHVANHGWHEQFRCNGSDDKVSENAQRSDIRSSADVLSQNVDLWRKE